jgi:hypothetical protein
MTAMADLKRSHLCFTSLLDSSPKLLLELEICGNFIEL